MQRQYKENKKGRPDGGRPDFALSWRVYFVIRRDAVAADSTQFVLPPVLSIKRVIGNFGLHSMSRPPRLPVMLAARKPAKAPSSRCTPTPPLPVIVGP